MGVTIREILQSKYFSDYKVLAGKGALDLEAQAVVLFDAPDGYKWFRGKEFVITSGYLFKDNTKLFKEVIMHLFKYKSAALGVKTQRYLNEVPEEIIDLCNSLPLPLIDIPYDVPWIDVINAVNSIAMNRYINRINDRSHNNSFFANPHSLSKKIEQIAINLSHEITSPLSIVDVLDKKIFTYPSTYIVREDCVPFSQHYDLPFNYQKEVMCDNLNMFRIKDLSGNSRCPWIVVPITLRDVTVSNLIIWEECEAIDYYDMFALRLSYTLLLSIYEQAYFATSFERRFYDDFIQSLINGELDSKPKVIKALANFQQSCLVIDNGFICICIRAEGKEVSLYTNREKIYRCFLFNMSKKKCILGIINDSTMVLLYDISDFNKDIIKTLKRNLKNTLEELEANMSNYYFRIGIGDPEKDICNIKKSYIEALKAIEIGSYIYPDTRIVAFEDLGPFGLIRVENMQKKSFGSNFKNIYPLLNEENAEELIETLKAFLESESNYNIAAKKLYLHSNTVRYRIGKIQQLCNIDLEDSTERLKAEIALKFINMVKK